MANWGLIDAATASGPQDVLAQILAEQAAKEAEMYKRGNEQRKLGFEGQDANSRAIDAGAHQATAALEGSKFTAEQSRKAQEDDDFANVLATAPAWMKPVLQFKRAAGITTTPQEVTMSPQQIHDQGQADAVTVAERAVKAKAAEEAAQLRNSITLKQTPSAEMLAKPSAVGDDPFMTPGPTVQQGAGPNVPMPKSVLGGFRPVSAPNTSAQSTGAPAPLGRASGAGPVGVPQAPASVPETAQPTPPAGPQGETDEAFLNTLPQEIRMRVKAIADGNYPIPARGQISDPSLARDIRYAMRYDPTLNLNTYTQRGDTGKKFATGEPGKEVQDLNTAIAHLASMDQSIEGLNNWGGGLIGKGVNFLRNAGRSDTDPAISKFNVDQQSVGNEIAKVYGDNAQGGREQTQGRFSIYGTPEANRGALSETLKLLKGKIDALDNQYKTGMGGKRFQINDLLSPEARTAYESLVKKYAGDSSASSAPKVGDTRTANGETRHWDGSAWVR